MKMIGTFHLLAGSAALILLLQTGCATYGPVSNTTAPAPSQQTTSPLQASTSVTQAVPNIPQQPHPTEIFIEDGLAQMITAEESKSENVDLWIEIGNDKRYIRFRNPYIRMQWDIVNLRLKDQKEPPIKLGTKLDSRFDTLYGQTGPDSMEDMQQVFNAISPMLNSVSYGGGGYGGGFGGSGFGQMGQFMEGIQRINAYTKNKADIANRSSHEAYIGGINEMFMQDGFAVTPIRKGAQDFSMDKPDYIVEEVWGGGGSGMMASSFRIFSGDGHLLFQVPYHQSQFGMSLFIRSKMVTGEIDIKSEKYSILMEAINLWEAGNDDAALAEFQKVLDMDPKFVNGYRYRSKFFESKGRWEDAINDLTHAIDVLRARQRIKVLYERGQLYWETNKLDAAIKDFTQVLSWEPKAVWVQANRGFCWLEKNDLDKASSDFEAALARDPKYDVALCGRAWVLALRGQYEESLTNFNQALAMSPNYANALRGRGYCYKMLKEKAKAMDDLVTTVQLLSEDQSPIAEKRRAQIKGWLSEMESEVSVSTPL